MHVSVAQMCCENRHSNVEGPTDVFQRYHGVMWLVHGDVLFPLPLILVSVSFEEVRRHVFPMTSHMLSARKKKTWKFLQREEISDVFFDTSYIYEKAMGPIPELD